MHDDDILNVEVLNNPSSNLNKGKDDCPNPMMRMTGLVLGTCSEFKFYAQH